jgi:prevent-host-death family protein
MMSKTKTVPATAARIRFGEMLRDVRDSDIVVEKDGIPVAVLVSYEAYSAMRRADEPGTAGDASRSAAWRRFLEVKERTGGLTDEEAESWSSAINRSREGIAYKRGGSPLSQVADRPDGEDAWRTSR